MESMNPQMVTTSDACSIVDRRAAENSVAGRNALEEMRAALSDSIGAASSLTAQCSSEPSTEQTAKSQRKSSTAPDSGYSSLVDSPNSPSPGTLARKESITYASRRLLPKKPRKLRIYDKPIDQPTQARFLDLKVLFGRTLHEFLAKKKVTFTAIQMRLSVMGEDEASAKPWIIIACEKATLKTVKQFFGQPDIKQELQPNTGEWPAFELIVCDRALRLLFADADIDIEVFAPDWHFIKDLPLPSACGRAIKAVVGEKTRTATLGGMINVLSQKGEIKRYGLTSGHILPGDLVFGALENELEVKSVDEEGLDTHDSQAESYTVQGSDLGPPDLPGLDHPFPDGDDEEFEIEFGCGSMSPANDLASQGQEEQSDKHNTSYGTNIGRIVAHSGQSKASVKEHCNRDWALIELTEAHSENIGNCLIDGRVDRASPLQLTQVVEQETLQIDGERPVGVIRTSPSPSWGVLSRALSFIMISPGNAFTETYTLIVGPKSALKAGDSGSWVFDSQNYKVYGHVVAVDLFGEGVVVPMQAILMDIERKLNAKHVGLHVLFELSIENDLISQQKKRKVNATGDELHDHSGLSNESDLFSQNLRDIKPTATTPFREEFLPYNGEDPFDDSSYGSYSPHSPLPVDQGLVLFEPNLD
ncbi:hypothetical protein GJ744_011447 [Endocarpon pusillum]|uniref:Uncharacterized protein n=1 Tax=Endocarpon pusillum TaxID=364733 RepID=A0A8H7AD85_9EURO|nr:hypothetical protein GJ744_011447 [Endocarpon pusillum]